MWKKLSYKLWKGLIWMKIETSSSFFRVKNDRKAPRIPPTSCYPKASTPDFEIADLFEIVKRPNNYASGVKPPSPKGKGCELYKFLIVTLILHFMDTLIYRFMVQLWFTGQGLFYTLFTLILSLVWYFVTLMLLL